MQEVFRVTTAYSPANQEGTGISNYGHGQVLMPHGYSNGGLGDQIWWAIGHLLQEPHPGHDWLASLHLKAMLQQFPDGSFEQYQLLCSPALLQEQLLQQRDQVLFGVLHSSIESLLKAALSADCPENGTDDHAYWLASQYTVMLLGLPDLTVLQLLYSQEQLQCALQQNRDGALGKHLLDAVQCYLQHDSPPADVQANISKLGFGHQLAFKCTGMLLEQPDTVELLSWVYSDELLQGKVKEALEVLVEYFTDGGLGDITSGLQELCMAETRVKGGEEDAGTDLDLVSSLSNIAEVR